MNQFATDGGNSSKKKTETTLKVISVIYYSLIKIYNLSL